MVKSGRWMMAMVDTCFGASVLAMTKRFWSVETREKIRKNRFETQNLGGVLLFDLFEGDRFPQKGIAPT
jgi:hypothetical protein